MMTATYKPMLFSGPMVRAIMDGRKTQTRRVMERVKLHEDHGPPLWDRTWLQGEPPYQWLKVQYGTEESHPAGGTVQRHIPRIEPGDVLWVREAWAIHDREWHMRAVCYLADPDDAFAEWLDCGTDDPERWPNKRYSSRYMPRWACRLWLRVTAVRPERLQDITTADAIAEGMTPTWEGQSAPGVPHKSEIDQFADLWDSINAKRGHGWDTNPWVWVYTFERAARPEGWPG